MKTEKLTEKKNKKKLASILTCAVHLVGKNKKNKNRQVYIFSSKSSLAIFQIVFSYISSEVQKDDHVCEW